MLHRAAPADSSGYTSIRHTTSDMDSDPAPCHSPEAVGTITFTHTVLWGFGRTRSRMAFVIAT